MVKPDHGCADHFQEQVITALCISARRYSLQQHAYRAETSYVAWRVLLAGRARGQKTFNRDFASRQVALLSHGRGSANETHLVVVADKLDGDIVAKAFKLDAEKKSFSSASDASAPEQQYRAWAAPPSC